MSSLKPVPRSYRPDYPRVLSEAEIRELLRPSLLARFSRETILAGAVLTGLTASGCSKTSEAAGPTAPPGAGGGPQGTPAVVQLAAADDAAKKLIEKNTTRDNPALRKQVDQLIVEILGKHEKGFWNGRTRLEVGQPVAANPPVKYPSIPISFGNSCVGIFDTEAAREATRKLFKAYGIELKTDVPIKKDGYEFVADGYDAERGIGFELVMPEGNVGLAGKKFPVQDAASKLDAGELAKLNQDIAAKKVRMFVVPAEEYPNMDGDLYTPMQYYLASVIDYLNWVHGDNQIDKDKVLGLEPGAQVQPKWHAQHPPLPGCHYDTEMLKFWSVAGGEVSLDRTWGGFAGPSLKVKLEPQGKLVYTAQDAHPVFLPKDPQFACHLFVPEASAPLTVVIEVTGTNGKSWTIREKVESRWLMPKVHAKTTDLPFDRLQSVTVSVESAKPVTFHLDDVSLSLDPAKQPKK